jgi:5-methylcytosine-specific restriction protein A
MPIRRPVHRPAGAQTRDERRAAYDAARLSRSRIYGRRWQKLRAAYLAQNPLCECGCGYAAAVVDHRIPHNGDPALIYAWDNLQAMTKPCHDKKTAGRDGGFGNRPAYPNPQKSVGTRSTSLVEKSFRPPYGSSLR